MAQVEITHEHEDEAHGRWAFEAQILDDAGTLRHHHLTLAWADYNLWSRDGAVPRRPSRRRCSASSPSASARPSSATRSTRPSPAA